MNEWMSTFRIEYIGKPLKDEQQQQQILKMKPRSLFKSSRKSANFVSIVWMLNFGRTIDFRRRFLLLDVSLSGYCSFPYIFLSFSSPQSLFSDRISKNKFVISTFLSPLSLFPASLSPWFSHTTFGVTFIPGVVPIQIEDKRRKKPKKEEITETLSSQNFRFLFFPLKLSLYFFQSLFLFCFFSDFLSSF